MAAEAENPLESLSLTVKVFVPMSASVGVPEAEPSPETLNQVGPLSLAKASVSPGTETALPESVAAKDSAATAGGMVNGLLMNIGTVTRKMVPLPPPDVRL